VEDFAARHHAYVSGDPHAAVGGTVLPVPAPAADMTSRGLACLADAVAAAMRTSVAQIRRRGPTRALFVALAYDQGWGHPERLAALCGCQPRAIRELVGSVATDALAVARLCLGDARLLRLPSPPPRVTRRGTHERDPGGHVKAPLVMKGLGPAVGRE
jgi:hypothetical protein